MKPLFVLIADGTEQIEGSGGKLNIYGAGISHLVMSELPAVAPSIAMVCNLLLEERDFGRVHTVYVSILRREDGHRLPGVPAEMESSMFQRHDDAEAQSINVVITFAGLGFERYGVYDFGLVIDDAEIASVPLVVRPS